MAIEVLLMEDVPHLGMQGEVVKVAEGYARNYLFPQKLAAPATAAMQRRLAKIQRQREEQRKAALARARSLAARLEGVSVTLRAKASEEGKLYGSITAQDIVDALREQGVELERAMIQLERPIKELGVYEVKVRLHAEVEGSVKVWVVEE